METKRGSTTELRVAPAQVDCALGDIQENARRAREAIDRAADLTPPRCSPRWRG
jgi:hypothetical protein